MGQQKKRKFSQSPIKPNMQRRKVGLWVTSVVFSSTTLALAYQFANSNVALSYVGLGSDRAFAFDIQNQGPIAMQISNFRLAPDKISLRTNKDLLLSLDSRRQPNIFVGEEEFFIEADAISRRLDGVSLRTGERLPLRIPPLIPAYGEKEKVSFSISYNYEPKINFLKPPYRLLELVNMASGKVEKYYLLESGQIQEISREASMGEIDAM